MTVGLYASAAPNHLLLFVGRHESIAGITPRPSISSNVPTRCIVGSVVKTCLADSIVTINLIVDRGMHFSHTAAKHISLTVHWAYPYGQLHKGRVQV